jgi:hypothetical protein
VVLLYEIGVTVILPAPVSFLGLFSMFFSGRRLVDKTSYRSFPLFILREKKKKGGRHIHAAFALLYSDDITIRGRKL